MFFFFFFFSCIYCGTDIIFSEIPTSHKYGFGNQVIFFKHLLYQLIQSNLSASNFRIIGPYSSHIGPYKNNCTIRAFFELNKKCKVLIPVDEKNQCKKVLSFLRQLQFINHSYSSSKLKHINYVFFHQNDLTIFWKKSTEYNDTKNKPNLFANYVEKNMKQQKIYLETHIDDNITLKTDFFEYFHFNSELETLAKTAKTFLFGKNASFLSIHLRLKDFETACKMYGCFEYKEVYLKAIEGFENKTKKQFFILTNENIEETKYFKTVTSKDLINMIKHHNFTCIECFISNIDYVKMFVEIQLVCESEHFFYNSFSTFSHLIMEICKKRKDYPRFSNVKKIFL